MALVTFNKDLLKLHGFPQACVCCGCDNGAMLCEEKLESKSSLVNIIAGIFFFLLGPIGWICIPLISMSGLVRRRSSKFPLSIPLCTLCRQARSSQVKRLSLALAPSILIFIVMYYNSHLAQAPLVMLFCAAAIALFCAEYCIYRQGFRLSIHKAHSNYVVVKVPYDEYSAIYQRHLDNATLYGGSEKVMDQ